MTFKRKRQDGEFKNVSLASYLLQNTVRSNLICVLLHLITVFHLTKGYKITDFYCQNFF